MAHYALDGSVTRRVGNADRAFAPHGVYPSLARPVGQTPGKDRFVAVAVTTDAQWAALTAVLDRPDLAADPLFVDAAGRRARRADLDEAVAAWTRTRSAEQAAEVLVARGIPAHVCADSRDFVADPQLRHRGHLVTLAHPTFGTAVLEGPRYLLSETPGRVERPAPRFGQDNRQVLVGLLGYDEKRYSDLEERGVLR
ncbi:CoA transferase [Frankia sp. AiPs1]|uniref:CoA transferase n=1 Tax=Frankia sp. AiPs1 TaxID=573493 RepID=UPI0020444ABC|nr:CoA transferase [Frankia sp. AiPs1]MCM3925796.1 CoA transferase [Frankia sp. AiPs1]